MQKILRPQTSAQVAEVITWAVANESPLEIRGNGSKKSIGRPSQAQETLSLAGLAGITLYEPEELILSAKAGTGIKEIEAALTEKNQELAFEPADYGPLLGEPAENATIGGILGANISGPRRLKAGAARDHFLGLKAISGRGEHFKSGGRVVKNVTGYDLCKGLSGSWGTLAVMTDVTIKVLPAAEKSTTLIVQGLKNDAAILAMSAAMNSTGEVSAAAHVPAHLANQSTISEISGLGASVTLLRLEGIGPSVDYRAKRLQELLTSFGPITMVSDDAAHNIWREVRDVKYFVGDQSRAVWRISVAPDQGAFIASTLTQAIPGAEFYFDWAGGLIWLSVADQNNASEAAIRAGIKPIGGHATLIRAGGSTRAAIDVFEPLDPVLMTLSKRLKDNFDPSGVLNPGRMYTSL